MNRRVERKLQEVVVARYSWRHEAEFAAGFLKDAKIPYRLQIDDPSLGISVSAAATIWVLGADEARARDVLDINEEHAPRLSGSRSANHPAPPKGRRPEKAHPGRSISAHSAPAGIQRGARGGALPVRARALAALGGMGLAGIGQAFFSPVPSTALEITVAIVASVLFLVGIIGWAPRFLRDLLEALSGSAP